MSNHNTSEYTRLKELGSSKFKVSDNEYDIRGWTVKNEHGRILGKVNDLLFDKESEKVLYIVLDLEGNEMHLRDRKVLAPLSIAELNEAYHNVTLPGVKANELTELPTYEKGKVSTRVEDLVQHAFANTIAENIRRETNSSGKEHKEAWERERQQHLTDQPADTSVRELKEEWETERHQHLADTPADSSERELEKTQEREHYQSYNKSRPQNVVGVFEHLNQGQVALQYLLDHNFKRNQIELSSQASEYQEDAVYDEDHSVTNWFKSVFGNDDDAKTYSEAARTGCVITVYTSSIDEAERAAEILDKHGALNIDDTLKGQTNTYKSRILDRKEAQAKWGNRNYR